MSSLTRTQKRVCALIAAVLLAIVIVALAAGRSTTNTASPEPSPAPATTQADQSERNTTHESPSAPAAENAPGSKSADQTPAVMQAADSTTAAQEASPAAQSAVEESINAQVKEATPQTEPYRIPTGAQYEPNVVLVTVQDGTTAAQLAESLEQKGIQSVDASSVSSVTDDVLKVSVRAGSTIEDAVNELERSGSVQAAQPNYAYHVLEDAREQVVGPQPAPANDSQPSKGNAGAGTDTDEEQQNSPATNSTAEDESNGSHRSTHASDSSQEGTTSAASEESGASTALPQASEDDALETQATSPASVADLVNDPSASSQWALSSIDAAAAWSSAAFKSATNTSVAILDDTFDTDHEDLKGNIAATYNATTKSEGDVRLVGGSANAGHGTHVAGIVAATSNNGLGIAGVGNNHLKLALIRLLRANAKDTGALYEDDVVTGYDYLIANKDKYNIRVASMSIGAKVESIDPRDAILRQVDRAYAAGIVTTASAGNATNTISVPYVNYPGDYKNIVSVINLQRNGDPKNVIRSAGSNYNAPGETTKDISAPGTSIYSTVYNGYGYKSGTSMATPHAAATLGLIFAANPSLTADEAVNILYTTARDLGDAGWDEQYGYGEINAANPLVSYITGPEYLAVGQGATWAATNKVGSNDPSGFEFLSSDPAILSLEAGGAGEGKSCGTATITATKDGESCSKEVTVLGPIQANPYVPVDGSVQASVATPQAIGDLAWTWASSDDAVATVTNAGVVYGHKTGAAHITATLVADPNVTLSCDVVVYEPQQEAVYLPYNAMASIPNELGIPQPEGEGAAQQVAWESTNADVAAVDEIGEVRGVSAGQTVIKLTATYASDATATYLWPVVVYGPLEGASVVTAGKTAALSVRGWDDLPSDLKQAFAWSSGSEAVATVDDKGVVSGVKAGTATIYATATKDGKQLAQFSAELEVVGPSLKAIPKPTAKTGLVYDATEQTGVAEGEGYTLTGSTATDAGEHEAVAKLKDGFVWDDKTYDDATISWTIAPATLNATYEVTAFVGERPSPTATVTGFKGSESPNNAAGYTAPVVTLPQDLSKPGKYSLMPSGGAAKNYVFTYTTGSLTLYGKAKIPIPAAGLTYNGRMQTGVASGAGFDLTGTYAATNAGTYKATAKLQAYYCWSDGTTSDKTVTWSIARQAVTVPAAKKGLVYNRSAQTGVASGSLYYLSGVSRATNTGSYTAIATLKDAVNYRWTDGTTTAKAIAWSIGAVPFSSCAVSTIGTQAYTGKAVCPRPSVTWGGRALTLGTEYTLSYRNNVRAGTATVTIAGRGNFCWSRSATFRIVAPTTSYRTHVQNVGWQGWKGNGAMSGTSGRGLRLEGINLKLGSLPVPGGIQYRTHVQNIGWQGWRSDGAMSGTSGRGLRLEAIEIRLTGQMAQRYDVYYRVHAQNIGWMGWARNGARSGTAGFGWRLEAIQVVLVPKGQAAPATTYLGIRQATSRAFRQR